MLPSMCLSKYNHTLHFREGNISFYFSTVTFVYIRMRVELLYLLIEEFHIRRYRVVSSVTRLRYSNIEGLYYLNLNLNSLLVKRQIDNPSPGAVTGGN